MTWFGKQSAETCRNFGGHTGSGRVSKSFPMALPSRPQMLDAAAAAGAVGKGPKPGSGLRTRVFFSSIREEDGLCHLPSGFKLSNKSRASGGTTSFQLNSVAAGALREVPFRDVGPSRIVTTLQARAHFMQPSVRRYACGRRRAPCIPQRTMHTTYAYRAPTVARACTGDSCTASVAFPAPASAPHTHGILRRNGTLTCTSDFIHTPQTLLYVQSYANFRTLSLDSGALSVLGIRIMSRLYHMQRKRSVGAYRTHRDCAKTKLPAAPARPLYIWGADSTINSQ